MVIDSSGVHEQVTQLCKKILKDENNLVLNSSDIVVKHLRSVSFEILLNKSNKPCEYGIFLCAEIFIHYLACSCNIHLILRNIFYHITR